MSLTKEFREFAMRGNVVDLAVGVVIGGAFGKVVSSLVADVIMPVLGILISGINLSKLAVTLVPATPGKAAVLLSYGKLLEACIDFLIVAFAIFMLVKSINRLSRKPAAPPAPPEPSAEETLLTEIRDLLKARG